MLVLGADMEEDTEARPGLNLSAAKAAAAKGKKRKQRKGHLLCGGCDELMPHIMFDESQAVCKGCKKYLDRIYNQCVAQGEKRGIPQDETPQQG